MSDKMSGNKAKGVIWNLSGAVRPNFLVLTPTSVLLGAAIAWYRVGTISIVTLGLALVGAVMAHASVNLFNEYEDDRSGLDATTERTPFSGGSGTLQAYPDLARSAWHAAWVTLAITAAIGTYFLTQHGLALAPLGLAGLLLVLAYSTQITRRPLLCLLAPGLGFGPLMVIGTEFVLAGSFSRLGLIVSLTPLFLVSNLLLINQFPDAEPDARVGRRHLPIVMGRSGAAVVYASFLLAALISPLLGYSLGLVPKEALLVLVMVIPAVPLARGAVMHADDIPRLVPFLGLNVVVTLLSPVLLAAGLVWAR